LRDGWIIVEDAVGEILDDTIIGMKFDDGLGIDGDVVGKNVKFSIVGEILGVEIVGVFVESVSDNDGDADTNVGKNDGK